MAGLRELVIALGIEVDTKQLDAADKRLKELARNAAGGGSGTGSAHGNKEIAVETEGFVSLHKILEEAKGALLGFLAVFAVEHIGEFLREMAEQGKHLEDLSERFGISTDEIQKWQFALKMGGVEADLADQSLKKFQVTVGHAANGNEEAAKAFAAMHVQLKNSDGSMRSLTDIAADVADNVSKLGDEAKMAGRLVDVFGKQGGALIPVMKHGSEGMRELYGQFEALGGGLDHEFIKSAAHAKDEIGRMDLVTKTLKSRIAVELLPAFTAWLQMSEKHIVTVIKLTRETKGLHTLLLALGGVSIVGAAIALKTTLIPQMIHMIEKSTKLKAALDFFGGGTGGFLKLAATAGVAALGILALYLIFDDLWSLMNGGKSVIGGVWEEMYGAGAAKDLVDDLRDAWTQLTTSAAEIKEPLKDTFKSMLSALPAIVELVVDTVKVVLALGLALAGVVKGAAGLYEATAGFVTGDKARQAAGLRRVDAAGNSAMNAILGKEKTGIVDETGRWGTYREGGLLGTRAGASEGKLGAFGEGVDSSGVYRSNIAAPGPGGAVPTLNSEITVPINIYDADGKIAASLTGKAKGQTTFDGPPVDGAFHALPGALRPFRPATVLPGSQ